MFKICEMLTEIAQMAEEMRDCSYGEEKTMLRTLKVELTTVLTRIDASIELALVIEKEHQESQR